MLICSWGIAWWPMAKFQSITIEVHFVVLVVNDGN